jgi:hypothetical protein
LSDIAARQELRGGQDVMKFHLPITTLTVLWILDFAAHLVLLVVLMGRDRMRRFPWFSAAIAFTALQLMSSQLLIGRIPPMASKQLFLSMAALTGFFNLMVAVEIARRAFGGVKRTSWLAGALAAIAVGAAVLAFWGNWPSLEMLRQMPSLNALQLIAQKALLLGNVEWAFVGLLIVALGSRAGAGFRTHVQQIAIGLMTAAVTQLSIQAIWEHVARAAMTQPRDVQYKALQLGDRLFDANRAIYLLVLIWWIVCLWKDEKGRDQASGIRGQNGGTERPATEGPGAEEPGHLEPGRLE